MFVCVKSSVIENRKLEQWLNIKMCYKKKTGFKVDFVGFFLPPEKDWPMEKL